MVAALPLAAKVAPAPAPPTAQVQPREVVEAVTTARAAKPIVVIPPRPRDAAAAQLPAPPCVRAVVLLPVKGVKDHVLELVKPHVPEVAMSVVWGHARIIVNIHVKIVVNFLESLSNL